VWRDGCLNTTDHEVGDVLLFAVPVTRSIGMDIYRVMTLTAVAPEAAAGVCTWSVRQRLQRRGSSGVLQPAAVGLRQGTAGRPPAALPPGTSCLRLPMRLSTGRALNAEVRMLRLGDLAWLAARC